MSRHLIAKSVNEADNVLVLLDTERDSKATKDELLKAKLIPLIFLALNKD